MSAMKYYVVDDSTDPMCQASEHDSFTEAFDCVRELQKRGCANAMILPNEDEPRDAHYTDELQQDID